MRNDSNLASIHSKEENDWIEARMNPDHGNYWIGLKYEGYFSHLLYSTKMFQYSPVLSRCRFMHNLIILFPSQLLLKEGPSGKHTRWVEFEFAICIVLTQFYQTEKEIKVDFYI